MILVCKIFFFTCLTVYLISMIEIVGSHFLTIHARGYCSNVNLVFCTLIPPVAPFFAISNYSCANDYYSTRSYNIHKINESFFGYIAHGFKTINQYYFKKNKNHYKKTKH